MQAVWDRKCDRPMPKTVVDSLYEAYGHDRELFVKSVECVRWDGLNGCWYLSHANMYVGIEEKDGYMHT